MNRNGTNNQSTKHIETHTDSLNTAYFRSGKQQKWAIVFEHQTRRLSSRWKAERNRHQNNTDPLQLPDHKSHQRTILIRLLIACIRRSWHLDIGWNVDIGIWHIVGSRWRHIHRRIHHHVADTRLLVIIGLRRRIRMAIIRLCVTGIRIIWILIIRTRELIRRISVGIHRLRVLDTIVVPQICHNLLSHPMVPLSPWNILKNEISIKCHSKTSQNNVTHKM